MPRIVDHDVRRGELAAAACKAIARYGIDGVKLTDIGELAGWTTGAITHYFADKNALLLAAFEYATNATYRRMDERLKHDETDFFGFICEALPLKRKHRAEYVVYYMFWLRGLGDRDAARRQRAFHAVWLSKVRACLIGMQDKGEIEFDEDIDQEVEALSAIINGIVFRATLDPADWPEERQVAQLRRYFDRLRPKVGSARTGTAGRS